MIKIVIVYLNVILLLASFTYTPFFNFDVTTIGKYLVYGCVLLGIVAFRDIRSEYKKRVAVYIIVLFLCMSISSNNSMSFYARFITPVLIFTTLKKKEYKYYSPLFYFFIFIFILNALVAFYERITLTHWVEFDEDNEMMQGQILYGDLLDTSFRSFALLGHPLWNANIMSYMSFMIFASEIIDKKYRIVLLFLGLASLFCFNARMAIVISLLLLIPVIKKIVLSSNYKIISFILFLVSFFILFINFSSVGGRLNEGFDDGSAMVRVLAIQEFFSYSFVELVVGNINYQYGEVGILEIIMTYGLILGLAKLFLEMFFCYNFLLPIENKSRIIILLSLILIGSSNNNLYGFKVIPFYILCATFIVGYSAYKNGLKDIKYA